MELFLIRHGETDANVNGIVQGWLDTDLNEHGKSQAHEAALNFGEEIDAIYSSDLKRATQTADEFRKKYPNVPYIEDGRLRERNFGDATGDHRDKHDWEVFWASRDTVSIPNAETLDEYNARVQSFIDTLRETHFSKVLIVTHGGTINRLQDLTSTNHQHIAHRNASLSRITI
ncbi:MAG: histidine phosphatase family protein [Candidatus Microsaccharimonas sp.]